MPAKRPTITDIARELDISTATVSRALSGRGYVREDVAARIHAKARELNYPLQAAPAGSRVLLIASNAAILWWQSQQILDNYTTIREQKSTQAMLSERNSGVQLSTCGEQRRRCVKVNPEAGRFGEDSSWMILAGK